MIQTIRRTSRAVRFDLTDPEDHISRRIIRFRDFYERDLLDDLRARVSGGVAVDVGAHIGNHTLWMSAVCGLSVVALEPNPASRAQLERNVALNNVKGRVRVIAAAAGRSPGRARLVPLNAKNTGMTRVEQDAGGDVEVITIDSLGLDAVSVIKIDVEGAELDILEGARETLERCRPLLYVEADGEERRVRLDAWLAELGYEPFGRYALTPTYGYHVKPPTRATRVSVAIMAHPSRSPFVETLAGRLDGAAQVVWDERGDRWDTGRRSLLAFDADATHHLVVQDDALVCRDLIAGATRAAQRNPHCATSFYLGRQRPHAQHFRTVVKQAAQQSATWIVGPELCWGVGLLFPVELIQPAIAFGDERPHVGNYDKRLALFLSDRGIPTWYTFPSLVDHRRQEESPSLVPGRTGPNRVAHHFIGEAQSALAIDWNAGLIALERRSGGVRVPKACPVCGADGYACGTAASPEPLLEVGT